MLPILTDTVTIVRGSLTAGYGNSLTYDFGPGAARTSVQGSVQPETGRETTGDRDTVIRRARVFLPGTADVQATDRIEWNGDTWDVDGEPARWPNPFGGGTHHIELAITRTTGG